MGGRESLVEDGKGERRGKGGDVAPFLSAFAFSDFRWTAAGLRVLSLSLAILDGWTATPFK